MKKKKFPQIVGGAGISGYNTGKGMKGETQAQDECSNWSLKHRGEKERMEDLLERKGKKLDKWEEQKN